MPRNVIEVGQEAPDFSVPDFRGDTVRLSDFRGKANVVLVLNRGLICPYCRKNMIELARAYPEFQKRTTEILAVGVDTAPAFERFWTAQEIPYRGLPDTERRVLRKYGQQVNLLRLGRLPAVVVIDRDGIVRYIHYGGSMMDIPPVSRLLEEIDKISSPASPRKTD